MRKEVLQEECPTGKLPDESSTIDIKQADIRHLELQLRWLMIQDG